MTLEEFFLCTFVKLCGIKISQNRMTFKILKSKCKCRANLIPGVAALNRKKCLNFHMGLQVLTLESLNTALNQYCS